MGQSMNYSKQNRKGSEKMNKRKKKKASSKSANLKKPISLLIDVKEIAKTICPYLGRHLPIDDKSGESR